MARPSEVVIVGAGPYGLSLAAHLRAANVPFRVFGAPMQTWSEHMPAGMLLKSDGFASNLSNPAPTFTLKQFCRLTDAPYDDTRIPIPLETFIAYGLAFQERVVPELEDVQVTMLERDNGGFAVHLDTGEVVSAANVVLAVGIQPFQYVPASFSHLTAERVSHSSAHKNPAHFRGRDVTVVGGGASAVDLAVLLHEAGAHVTLVARRDSLVFFDPPLTSPSLWTRARYPSSPIGRGWKSRIYCDAPQLFHRLPEHTRWRIAETYLGPAASFSMKLRFTGIVPALLGYRIEAVDEAHGRVRLTLAGHGERREHVTDHVIAATGYVIDVRRLALLSPDILADLDCVGHAPVLSPYFESSVTGLHFVGPSAKHSFGPMMRFACGSAWTARRLSKKFSGSNSRRPVGLVAASART